MSSAIIILGMHRSGTSCLAGMLAAAGVASAGEALRNWDNARGHHEMLDVIRLNEAVLAYSGGHWLSPPETVRWTDEHAAARDRLLRARIDGRPALLKDPRTLLTLSFWRASAVPYQMIGIVRHPLAVARSLEGWRATPLADGVALWTAHNRVLAEDREHHRYPLIDFDQPKDDVVAAVQAACAAFAPVIDRAALAAAYEEQLVHHDAEVVDVPGLDDAMALHRRLAGHTAVRIRPAFPRAQLAEVARLAGGGAIADALAPARDALASVADASAVLVPLVTLLVRHRAYAEAQQLIAEHAARLDEGLADLLRGKVLLAMGDAASAVRYLEAACAVAQPYFQARHLLPQALRGAGRPAEARAALRGIVGAALYPHGPLATLAEWSWLDGEHDVAITEMQQAIAAAPPHRRGRLRTRLAEWWLSRSDTSAARRELELAIEEDPGYPRSQLILAGLG